MFLFSSRENIFKIFSESNVYAKNFSTRKQFFVFGSGDRRARLNKLFSPFFWSHIFPTARKIQQNEETSRKKIFSRFAGKEILTSR